MENMDGCQVPNIPNLSEGLAQIEDQPFLRRAKRALAVPWNYHVKRWIKHLYRNFIKYFGSNRNANSIQSSQMEMVESAKTDRIQTGDWVQIRSWDEIKLTLDPFNETRGCAFLEDMRQYCGTSQRVLKSMERFLDERDYKVKKINGVILLENVICNGTPSFGKCDRCCFLFWREEWLEKIPV